MKKKTYLLIITIICSLMFSIEASANKDSKSYRICKLKKGVSLKVHLHPTVHSNVVVKLSSKSRGIKKRGQRIYRHSKWYKVSWKGHAGWIKNVCLTTKPSKSATRVVAQ